MSLNQETSRGSLRFTAFFPAFPWTDELIEIGQLILLRQTLRMDVIKLLGDKVQHMTGETKSHLSGQPKFPITVKLPSSRMMAQEFGDIRTIM